MKKMTRRQALGAAAATLGAGLVGSLSPGEQALFSAAAAADRTESASGSLLPDVWGADFMPQWSAPDDLQKNLTVGTTPVRLACNAHPIIARSWSGKERRPWEEQIKAVRDGGYTATESFAWGWDEEHVKDSDIREILQLCTSLDVEFYTLHVWANIIHPDPEERARIHRLHADAVATAERLGMKFILTHTGGRHPENKDTPHPLNHTRETWQMSVDAVKKILKDTAGSQVKLAFEAVNSCNNNTPQSHLRLMEDVGDERVKAP